MLALLISCAAPSSSLPLPLDSGQEAQPLVLINELLASSTQPMGGGTPDWIELYNPTQEPVSLEGWSLALNEQEAWPLEPMEVPAGGFLVLYADGEPELGPEHLGLRLPQSGAQLSLRSPEQELVDQVDYPKQATDISATRAPAGGPGWVLSAQPSPGQETQELAPEPAQPQPLDCSFAHDLDQGWVLEGELVELSVSCAGAELLPVSLVEGGSYAPDTQSWSWQTGAADSGSYRLVFSLRGQGDTESPPQAESISLEVADDLNNPDNVPPDPAQYTTEWGLPVFHIQIDEALSQSYTYGTLNYMGQELEVGIKIRGATSSSYAKTSFSLDFPADELEVDAWDTSRNKLVLVSNFDDNSYVRAKLVFDQWKAMADYWGEQRLTPRSYYAVVYLNGSYHGLYTALDKVDDEFAKHMGFQEGNLYKAVNHDANFALTDSSGRTKSNLAAGYEKKEGADGDTSDLQALVAFTGAASAEELVQQAEQWISLDEFMDWFLLVHYSLSEDSAGKNSYLHVDPTEQRFRFAPWDFNHSWGQNWYTLRTSAQADNYYEGRNRVFWAIQNDPDQELVLWQRFEQMRADGPYNPEWILAQVDGYYAEIEPSAQRDWERWGGEYKSAWWAGYRSDWTDYQGEKAYLYQWLQDRALYFEELHP